MNRIQIYNSIGTDELSKVRGLGRYYKTLEKSIGQIDAEDGVVGTKSILINPFLNICGTSWFGVLGAKGAKIGVIHDVIPLKYPTKFPLGAKGQIRQCINRSLLMAYDLFVTDSKTSKKDILHHLGILDTKVHVIYPYSPLGNTVASGVILPSEIEAQKYVLYVGDVNWHKNIANIARACVQAKIKLVCVGKAFMQPMTDNPWLDELEDFLRIAAQNPDYVTRLGYVTNEMLVHLYTNALVNILVSRDEGFGYSYVEAGTQRTPSILADRPICHEISDGKGALFVDPEKVEDISEAIHRIVKGQDLRRNLGEEAFTRSQIYNEQSFTAAWQTVLKHYG